MAKKINVTVSIGELAVRLVNHGEPIRNVSRIIYGIPGGQAGHAIRRMTTKVASESVVERLQEEGYEATEVTTMVRA